MTPRPGSWLVVLLCLCTCGDDSSPGTAGGSSSGSATGTSATSSSSSGPAGSTTGSADSTTSSADSTGVVDPSTSSTGSTGTPGDSSDSSSSGEPEPPNGCSDGEREALTDEATYPDIAACSGGWEIPGVLVNTAFCDREGGDDGPNPVGRGCSVEDLCSAGWHVCDGLGDVLASGIASCDAVFWGGAFFVTRQSSEGSNTCTPIGLNDVFGCGDIGFQNIMECAPLNRGTANLCVELPDPWSCDESADEEAEFIIKSGPQFGGALCCRD